jgi:hypothetical protein
MSSDAVVAPAGPRRPGSAVNANTLLSRGGRLPFRFAGARAASKGDEGTDHVSTACPPAPASANPAARSEAAPAAAESAAHASDGDDGTARDSATRRLSLSVDARSHSPSRAPHAAAEDDGLPLGPMPVLRRAPAGVHAWDAEPPQRWVMRRAWYFWLLVVVGACWQLSETLSRPPPPRVRTLLGLIFAWHFFSLLFVNQVYFWFNAGDPEARRRALIPDANGAIDEEVVALVRAEEHAAFLARRLGIAREQEAVRQYDIEVAVAEQQRRFDFIQRDAMARAMQPPPYHAAGWHGFPYQPPYNFPAPYNYPPHQQHPPQQPDQHARPWARPQPGGHPAPGGTPRPTGPSVAPARPPLAPRPGVAPSGGGVRP